MAHRFLAPAVLSLGLLSGCGMFSDPAVRLAYCIEEGVKKPDDAVTSIQVNCDLKLSGNYVVVLHPDAEMTDDELAAGGVPASAIPAVRALRNGTHAAIYVVAAEKQAADSRTTYQNNFVRIEHVMAVAKSSQPVAVDIGGRAGERTIQAIR